MKKCLVDSGPLVALFNNNEAIDIIQKHDLLLFTTWPVITEVAYLLGKNRKIVQDFLNWTYDGGLRLLDISLSDLNRIIHLVTKYSDVPMDFADASLVAISERESLDNIFSFDSDFYIYRHKKKSFNNIWNDN
ncbi:MAG: PIN domain-containing protein [Leptospirales bacterium]